MTLPREQVLDVVRAFVADSFLDGRRQGLAADAALVTSGIVDSAGVVHLVEFLERRFAITIADDEVGLANFNTLRAIGALVTQKLVPAPTAPSHNGSSAGRAQPKRAPATKTGRKKVTEDPRSPARGGAARRAGGGRS